MVGVPQRGLAAVEGVEAPQLQEAVAVAVVVVR